MPLESTLHYRESAISITGYFLAISQFFMIASALFCLFQLNRIASIVSHREAKGRKLARLKMTNF
jgi:hypothetical protein